MADTNLNLSNSDLTFARYEFVNESPGVAVPIIIVLVIGSIVGTFGNILILITIFTTKNLHRLECIFMANLAFSDMYITLFADPLSVVAKLEGEEFFNNIPGFCQVIASGCTISCINSLGSIALLGFNRYVFICHYQCYSKIFKKKTCIIMCCCLYAIGLLLVLLNFAGVGDHSFDRKSLECIWDRMATYPYTVAFSITLVWIPLTIIGLSYACIFRIVRKSRLKMKLSTVKRSSYSTGLARTFFIIYIVFSVCWIPYAVLLISDRHDTFSHEVHLYITVWAHLHPSFNWLVYYFTNSKFEKAFNRLVHLDVCFVKCRGKKEEEEITTTTAHSSSDILLDSKTDVLKTSSPIKTTPQLSISKPLLDNKPVVFTKL